MLRRMGMIEIQGLKQYEIDVRGVDIHVAEAGEGPMVLFVHGFPESWYSWRHQIAAVSAAVKEIVILPVALTCAVVNAVAVVAS